MEPQQPQSKFAVPVAIVIAGALIAGAVFYNGSKQKSPVVGVQTGPTEQATSPINIPPVKTSDHILGNPNSPIVMVEYSDIECPFCKTFHVTAQKIMDTYGKNGQLAWVYRHFPLAKLHPKAPKEAEATECANELGGPSIFWKYVGKIFEVTPSNNGLDPAQLPKIAADFGIDTKTFNDCLDNGKYTNTVQKSYDNAVAAGGLGTPYTIFILRNKIDKNASDAINVIASNYPPGTVVQSDDGYRVAISGALPYTNMEQIVKTLLGA